MAKNKSKLIISILAGTLVVSACQPKKNTEEEKSAEVQQKQPILELTGDNEKLNFNLPKCEDKNCPELSVERLNSNQAFINDVIDQQVIQILQQTLTPEEADEETTQAEVGASEVNKEAIETAKQKLERELAPLTKNFLDLDQEVKALSANHKISLMVKPKILNSQGPLVTVVLNSSNYLGGAHGASSQQYFNFDLKDKKQIVLNDIIEKNKSAEFESKVYDAFKAWVIDSELATDIKEYEQIWKFRLADNFYLGTQGLILQYGEYDIGPYVVGLPRLTIPYDQLQGILKDKYLPEKIKSAEQAASEIQPAKK